MSWVQMITMRKTCQSPGCGQEGEEGDNQGRGEQQTWPGIIWLPYASEYTWNRGTLEAWASGNEHRAPLPLPSSSLRPPPGQHQHDRKTHRRVVLRHEPLGLHHGVGQVLHSLLRVRREGRGRARLLHHGGGGVELARAGGARRCAALLGDSRCCAAVCGRRCCRRRCCALCCAGRRCGRRCASGR